MCVAVAVGVAVAVEGGVAVGVEVGIAVEVDVGVAVGIAVLVGVGVGDGVGVAVGAAFGVAVLVGVGEGTSVGSGLSTQALRTTASANEPMIAMQIPFIDTADLSELRSRLKPMRCLYKADNHVWRYSSYPARFALRRLSEAEGCVGLELSLCAEVAKR